MIEISDIKCLECGSADVTIGITSDGNIKYACRECGDVSTIKVKDGEIVKGGSL